jgi:hypothetical protein
LKLLVMFHETVPIGRSAHSPLEPGAIVERYCPAAAPTWASLVANGSVDGS